MGISSLGTGSNILTQDVLDQLRAADDAGRIKPITLELANVSDKQDALKVIDASMTNLIDSINAIKSATLYDARATTASGTAVSVTAAANSDIQDFTLSVTSLATKQIEQSGLFTAKTETIANAAGSMNLNIGGTDFTINYDATTTLDDLKNLINDVAGTKVDATVVQLNSADFRLFISAADTGAAQNITITDTSANLKDARLTTGFTNTQVGADAIFSFNGQSVTRASNTVTDLVSGLTVTLKEAGTSNVSVKQDREGILSKMDSFVEKYNSTMTELNKMIKPSTDSKDRGIFSTDSTIKSMKRAIEDVISSVGGGVGSLVDYGFTTDKAGKMSLDKTIFGAKVDANPTNVEAFFSGGNFTKPDASVVVLTGAFTDISTKVESYTKFGEILDDLKDSLSEENTLLTERKTLATERLDAKYAIMKKQFAAYDSMISKFNSASSMFTQMANANSSN